MTPEFTIAAKLSITVQFAVVTTLLVYFLLLKNTVRLEEVRLWSAAWFSDAVALGAVLYSSLHANGGMPLRLTLFLYLAGKTAFFQVGNRFGAAFQLLLVELSGRFEGFIQTGRRSCCA